jgi:hypothetical protein
VGGFFERLVLLNAQLIAEWLREAAAKIEEAAPGTPASVSAGWEIPMTQGGLLDMGEITVKDTSEPLTARVTFRDAEGYETAPESTPDWSSSDTAVADITPGEDGLSASIAIGGPGSAVVQVEVADTEGGEPLLASGLINVTAGDAVIGDVSFEAPAAEVPVEQPPVEEVPPEEVPPEETPPA